MSQQTSLSERLRKVMELKATVIGVLHERTQEMEGYEYYGSNPGVSEDDYAEIADEIDARLRPLLVELVRIAEGAQRIYDATLGSPEEWDDAHVAQGEALASLEKVVARMEDEK